VTAVSPDPTPEVTSPVIAGHRETDGKADVGVETVGVPPVEVSVEPPWEPPVESPVVLPPGTVPVQSNRMRVYEAVLWEPSLFKQLLL
jgi:hypothetical protein